MSGFRCSLKAQLNTNAAAESVKIRDLFTKTIWRFSPLLAHRRMVDWMLEGP